MDKMKIHLEGKNTALIVVDVQNDYCHPDGAIAKSGIDVSSVKQMMPHLHFCWKLQEEAQYPSFFCKPTMKMPRTPKYGFHVFRMVLTLFVAQEAGAQSFTKCHQRRMISLSKSIVTAGSFTPDWRAFCKRSK